MTTSIDNNINDYCELNISKSGYVYIFHNELYGNEIYKIGRSINVDNRIKNYKTYYYKKTKILFISLLCVNNIKAEFVIHKILSIYRLDIGEFFNVKLDIAINVINNIVNNINNNCSYYDNIIRNKKYSYNKKNIINAIDIDNLENINDLNVLLSNDKLSIEKYLYKQTFQTSIIDDKFMETNYRKNHIIHNFNYLINDIPLNINNITTDNKYIQKLNIRFEDDYITFMTKYKSMYLDILQNLGFNINKSKQKINQLIKNMITTSNKSIEYILYHLIEDEILTSIKVIIDIINNDTKISMLNQIKLLFSPINYDSEFNETDNEMKIRLSKYFASYISNNIYEWFCTIYESDNSPDNLPIRISDIYKNYSRSTLYNNLSKSDKRKYTQKYFNEKIQTNLFLKNNYKPNRSYYKGIRYEYAYIIGFKTKNNNDDLFNDIINI